MTDPYRENAVPKLVEIVMSPEQAFKALARIGVYKDQLFEALELLDNRTYDGHVRDAVAKLEDVKSNAADNLEEEATQGEDVKVSVDWLKRLTFDEIRDMRWRPKTVKSKATDMAYGATLVEMMLYVAGSGIALLILIAVIVRVIR